MPFYNHDSRDLWDNLRRLRDEETGLSPDGQAFVAYLLTWMQEERRRLSRLAEMDAYDRQQW